jgi:RNA polymerase sigma-70 factor (ECF subfamily)
LLDRALAALAPDLRAVLTLFEIEGLTFTEIALALELPRGTVASRLRRARTQFAVAARRLAPGGVR